MLRVLVCGGRAYRDANEVNRVLNEMRRHVGDFVVIHGGARGADLLAKAWARRVRLPNAEVEAYWYGLGKPAGPTRNKWMLELRPDYIVAFEGGTGTANMVSRARKAGVKTWGSF